MLLILLAGQSNMAGRGCLSDVPKIENKLCYMYRMMHWIKMEEPIKILIVDDHALLRRGLATLLGFDKSLSVAGDAKNGAEAVKAALELKPDVVVMDLSMPVMDGVEATRRIREALPSTRVLILTTYSTSVDVARAMKAGASGAFVKDADDDRLIEAIHKVAAGETAFSPEIESMLESEPHPPALTERQQNIL